MIIQKLFSRGLFPLAVASLLCLAVLSYGISLFFLPEPQTSTAVTSPTPPPVDPNSFPKITPQVFRGDAQMGTGTFIVTADMPDVFVYIDQPSESSAEVPLTPLPSKQDVPPQYAPFRADTIPVGTHEIVGVKPGYMAKRVTIEIKANEVTRYNFSLEEIR